MKKGPRNKRKKILAVTSTSSYMPRSSTKERRKKVFRKNMTKYKDNQIEIYKLSLNLKQQ